MKYSSVQIMTFHSVISVFLTVFYFEDVSLDIYTHILNLSYSQLTKFNIIGFRVQIIFINSNL
jgi:hypothetical protein